VGDGPPLQITDDATAPPEGEGLSYHRVAWSPGGALAFAAVERAGSRARSRLYVVDAPGQPRRQVAQDSEHFFIYLTWSPAAGAGQVLCHAGHDCRTLAYLIEGEDGVGLHLVELAGETSAGRPLVTGRPFYLSWAPDGRQIAFHAGARLGSYDLGRGERRFAPSRPGAFLAPAWSPDGGRWLGVVQREGREELRRFAGTRSELLLSVPDPSAEIAFSWSPDGTWVAYALRERPGDPFYGPVHLLDPDSGASEALTPAAFRPLAFFWSPDGRRLAYLSWLDLPGSLWAQWRVVDLVSGEDRGYAAFQPTPLMQFALHSFGQYAQSHRFWSPDGRYLVYAARDRTLVDRIWLVDTYAARGAEPVPVAGGAIAYWSWH
jgi:TolB protein